MESLPKETSASKYRDAEYADMEKAAEVEVIVIGKHGTESDARDMRRMGKPQSFQRNFAFYSTFGFSMVLMSSWEVQLATANFGLTNGGTAGAIYIYIATFFGFAQSIAGATAMTCILIILLQFCVVTNLTTASRQLFSFARDRGTPFHTFFER
ncbi:MAG: hypothetical protein Q9180_007947, partial [Flavoplaca navasiana]